MSINSKNIENMSIHEKLEMWRREGKLHEEIRQEFESYYDDLSPKTIYEDLNLKQIEYLADVTCKHPAFDEKYPIKRRIGIATHKDYQIKDFGFDSITNDKPIEEVIRLIAESEIVISNSFHTIYWAQLLGKKVICYAPFSSRFFSYKYKPQYLNDIGKLEETIEKCDSPNILDEARKGNDAFFEKVKTICDESLKAVKTNTSFEQLSLEGLLYSYEKEKAIQKEDGFVSSLLFDTGDGFKVEQSLCCINNVFEDKVHKVRFNLEEIKNIKALRFDPLEGLFCKTKILSVKSDNDNFKLNSTCCQNNTDGFDLFYTTDPQYYGSVEGNITFLEIEFELEIANGFEVKCAVYGLNGKCDWYANTLKEKDFAIGELNGKCDWYANTLKEKDSAIDKLDKELYSVYNSRSWKLTKPLRKVMKVLRKTK